MLQRIHQKLGTAGFVIAIVALFAALGGGAYAASGGLTGKQKKEVEKIAKKVAKPGTPGPAGPNGAAGAQGPAGTNGKDGTNGINGTNGTNGVSPAGTEFAGTKGGHCTEGGVEFKGANTTFACNGLKGATGFTETLPPGKTETGTWAMSLAATAGITASTAISFPIPLATEGEEGTAWAFSISQIENEEWGKKESNSSEGCKPGTTGCKDTGCRGTVIEPKAPAGTLCIYTNLEQQVNASGSLEARNFNLGFNAYGVSGATLFGQFLNGSTASPASVEENGTWAVTAPTS